MKKICTSSALAPEKCLQTRSSLGGQFAAFLAAAFLILVAAPPASAQISMIVSPPRYDEEVQPGQTIQKTVKITNSGESEIRVQANVYNFIVEDEAGTPVQVREDASGRYLAAPWFTLDRSSLVIAPNATELIYALITVPSDALPGGHYAGIYFSPSDMSAPPQTSGAGVLPQIGALFSLTVAGDIEYDALIKEFTTKQGLYEFGPVEFQGIVENQSDTHISPQASITIKDMLGRTLETLSLDQINIFPFKSRTLTAAWDQVWGLGRFTATLSVPYGSGHLAERTIFFWILPWRLLAAIAVVILVLIALVISIRRHIEHKTDTRDSEIDSLKHRIAELENNKR